MLRNGGKGDTSRVSRQEDELGFWADTGEV